MLWLIRLYLERLIRLGISLCDALRGLPAKSSFSLKVDIDVALRLLDKVGLGGLFGFLWCFMLLVEFLLRSCLFRLRFMSHSLLFAVLWSWAWG